jgi:hypothetical protein
MERCCGGPDLSRTLVRAQLRRSASVCNAWLLGVVASNVLDWLCVCNACGPEVCLVCDCRFLYSSMTLQPLRNACTPTESLLDCACAV